MLAADDSVVSWGPSPTYGELVKKVVFLLSRETSIALSFFPRFSCFPFCLGLRVEKRRTEIVNKP